MSLVLYLNGQFVPHEQATVSVEDRAFLFADGIYEVVRVYNGRPFCMNEHLERLARSACEIRLPEIDLAHLKQVSLELLERNHLTDATIYIQVSRGTYTPRTHAFPRGPIAPTVLVMARSFSDQEISSMRVRGVSAITVPDQRWGRCDIKSVSLLPNILAKQAAVEADAYEAILVRDGYALEGSSSNVMAVLNGEIWTPPRSSQILGGITRQVVLATARKLGFPIYEKPIPVSQLSRCSELWVTSTTSEIMPIIRVDTAQIGDGHPGPVFAAVHQAFRSLV